MATFTLNSPRAVTLACALGCSTAVDAGHDPIPTPIAHGAITIELQSIVSGVNSPNVLTDAGDGSNRLFFTEQKGTIRVMENNVLLPTPLLDLSSRLPADFGSPVAGFEFDERCLLCLAFHPQFDTNRKFYTFTSEAVNGAADFSVTLPHGETFDHQSVITEWTADAVNPNVVDDSRGGRELLRINNPQFNHNGGMLNFSPHDNLLYISLGDGGSANDIGSGHSFPQGNAQDNSNILGTILRIDPDGNNSSNGNYGVPVDNPFIKPQADPGDDIPDEIFATGLRNPYRFNFDPVTGELIAGDVGQGEIEEINLITAGGNFGWNLKEGSFRFDPNSGEISIDPGGPLTADLIDPVAEYDHDEGISVIGGFVYRGTAIAELTGKYVFGDFSLGFASPNGRLFYADLVSGVIEEFTIGFDARQLGLYVNGIGQDADGELYVLATRDLGPLINDQQLGLIASTGGSILKIVAVPLPAGVWLLSSALLGLASRRRCAGAAVTFA